PSPSKAAPKSAFLRFPSSFNLPQLSSVSSAGRLGKEASGVTNSSASVFSFTRFITSGATNPMLPFPQSRTILFSPLQFSPEKHLF
ncbi:MAG: hypothetical protein KAT65_15110, partial [Methanophagales archaeon]|nr:hypothetical protein [Methanophagales archaeon]